jgi:hypothetical protein
VPDELDLPLLGERECELDYSALLKPPASESRFAELPGASHEHGWIKDLNARGERANCNTGKVLILGPMDVLQRPQ